MRLPFPVNGLPDPLAPNPSARHQARGPMPEDDPRQLDVEDYIALIKEREELDDPIPF